MPEFAWVWNEIGVNSLPFRYEQTIPVPLGGRTLVMLRAAKGLPAPPSTDAVDVTEVNPQVILAQLDGYLDDNDVSGDARKDFLTRMYAGVHSELLPLESLNRNNPNAPRDQAPLSRSKLLVVKGKVARTTMLQAGPATQQVEVIRAASYTVSFMFLQRPAGKWDPDAALWTKRSPSEADDWISKLNWIFGSQANITFLLGTSQLLPLDPPAYRDIVKKSDWDNFFDNRDPTADFTVFLCGDNLKFVGSKNDTVAESDQPPKGGSWATLIPDNPNRPGDDKPDEFIVILAHELSHCIQQDKGNMHFCEEQTLRSRGRQTTKIQNVLRSLLVNRGKAEVKKSQICD
jgi:hypothetical protein